MENSISLIKGIAFSLYTVLVNEFWEQVFQQNLFSRETDEYVNNVEISSLYKFLVLYHHTSLRRKQDRL